MHNRFGMRLVAVVVTAVWAVAGWSAEIRWARSWEDAQTQARASNKLIMIDFFTDWCGWCKRLDAETLRHESVVKAAEAVVSVKVNAEKEGVELARRFGVRGFPTVLFVDAEGAVAGRIVGFRPAPAFFEAFQGVLKDQRRLPDLRRALASAPNDRALNAELSGLLARRGDTAGAVKHLEAAVARGLTGEVSSQAHFAVGEALQEASQFEAALPLFERGVAATADPRRKSFGLLSIAICHLQLERLEAAQQTAQRIVDLEGADPQHVETARRILALRPRE